MNTNLLAIVKQIVETQGEEILSEPQRMKAFFSDLAKDEPKPERIAFGRCLEYGFAQILKNVAVTEREKCKQELAKRLRDEEGLDLTLCENSLELLSAVLFGEKQQQKKDYCKKCGKELQSGWQACPYCATANAQQNPSQPQSQPSSVPASTQKKNGWLLAAMIVGVIGFLFDCFLLYELYEVFYDSAGITIVTISLAIIVNIIAYVKNNRKMALVSAIFNTLAVCLNLFCIPSAVLCFIAYAKMKPKQAKP